MGHSYFTCIFANGDVLALQRHAWLYPSDEWLRYNSRLRTLLSSNVEVLDTILTENSGHTQHPLLETYIQLASFDPTTGRDLFSERVESTDELYIDDNSCMTAIDISDPRAIRQGFIDREWKVVDVTTLADGRGLTDRLVKDAAGWRTISQDTIGVLRDPKYTQLSRPPAKNDDRDDEGPHLVQIIYRSYTREESDEGVKRRGSHCPDFICSIPLRKMTTEHQIGMMETFFTFLSQQYRPPEVDEILMAAAKSYSLGDEDDKRSNTIRHALPDELCEIATDLYHSVGKKAPGPRRFREGEWSLFVTYEQDDLPRKEKPRLNYAFVTHPTQSDSFVLSGDWWHPSHPLTIVDGTKYFQDAAPDIKQAWQRVSKNLQMDMFEGPDFTETNFMDDLNHYARQTATAPPMCLALKAKQYSTLNEAFREEFAFEIKNMEPTQKARSTKLVQGLQWLCQNGYDRLSISSYAAFVWLITKTTLRSLGDDLVVFEAAFTGRGNTGLPCLLRLTGWERRLLLGSLKLKLQGLEHLPNGVQTARFSCFLQLLDSMGEEHSSLELPSTSWVYCRRLCDVAVKVFRKERTVDWGHEAIRRLEEHSSTVVVFGSRRGKPVE